MFFRLAAMAVIAAGMMQAGALAAATKGPMRFFGLTFPAHMAGSRLESHHDFEKKAPGLGHGIEYRAPGWKINVYIYDLNKKQIPADPDSSEISAQLKQAEGDVFAAQDKGIYSNVGVERTFMLRDLSKRARLRCVSFSLTHKSAGDLDSFLCLTGWRGKFVKFRVSTARSAGSEAAVRQYMGAWIAHLWPNS
jgi:hypothetical protein